MQCVYVIRETETTRSGSVIIRHYPVAYLQLDKAKHELGAIAGAHKRNGYMLSSVRDGEPEAIYLTRGKVEYISLNLSVFAVDVETPTDSVPTAVSGTADRLAVIIASRFRPDGVTHDIRALSECSSEFREIQAVGFRVQKHSSGDENKRVVSFVVRGGSELVQTVNLCAT